MSVWDDFTLGGAGLADALEAAVGIESHHAADVYAAQTASAYLDEHPDATPAEVAGVAIDAAGSAVDAQTGGALSDAANATAGKVFEGAGKAVSWAADTTKRAAEGLGELAGWLPWLVGGLAVVAVVVAVRRVVPNLADK